MSTQAQKILASSKCIRVTSEAEEGTSSGHDLLGDDPEDDPVPSWPPFAPPEAHENEFEAQAARRSKITVRASALSGQDLEVLWFSDLNRIESSPQIVRGLIISGSLAVLYGESNSGKTFFALDLALAVAAGAPWRGMRTRRGLVIYVAGEGAASVRSRVVAYRRQHPDVSDLPFAIVPQAIDFLDADRFEELIHAIRKAETKSGEKAALVIVDTFARAIAGGDENSAQDVGSAVRAADKIRAETGAAVVFVHHAGKDPSKGARGSSALRAAVDTEILVERGSGQRFATVTKQRDLEVGARFPFELKSVEVGTDPEDSMPITSCVVRHLDDAAVATPGIREFRGKAQRQFVNAMRARSEASPNRIWSLIDLRAVARELGQQKNTARAVVDAVTQSNYMVATVGGYFFTDGKPRDKEQ